MYKHKKMNAVAAASIVLESGIINVTYAQVLQRLPSTGPEIITPGANPMCDPNDRQVNTRESYVCGLPKTPSDTGVPESLNSISPGANPV